MRFDVQGYSSIIYQHNAIRHMRSESRQCKVCENQCLSGPKNASDINWALMGDEPKIRKSNLIDLGKAQRSDNGGRHISLICIYNLTIHPPNHPSPPSYSHVFPISKEARSVTSARTSQEAETRCNSTFMCRVQKVSLITLPASIHHPYHLIQIEASL